MRKKTLLRPSPIRIPLRRMDNSTSARPRNKFWFAFLALFALWYLLLYDTDWSSFPGIKSISRSHTHSLRSLGFDSPRKRRFINGNNISKVDVGDISRNLSTVENGLIESVVERKQRSTKSCNGRYIYMHELPTRFNENVLKDCKSLSKWINMCLYLENLGLGPPLENPQSLLTSNSWFATDQFSLEIIFHNRMKRYKCLTNDSSEASAIYVPYYAGLDIARYLFDSHNISTKDSSSLELMKWLRSKPEWEKMWGKDHFMVVGRITWDFRRAVDEDSGWGNKLMLLPESQNMTMLTIESSPWHKNDFAIPYPTYFHPSNDNEIFQWQTRTRKRKRVTLFTFVGGLRPTKNNDVRVEIIKQCQASRRKCKLLECKDKSLKCSKPFYIMKMFQSSIFCLQPPGDSYTRRSTFDTILAGCIPVFFSPGSAYVQYLWHLPRDFSKYSVLIPEDAIKGKKANIENILSRIPRSKVLAMQEEVIKLIPKVVYANPMSSLQTYEDAFDLTIKGVVDRVEEFRQGKNSSFDAENSWKYYTFGNVGKHEWDHFFSKDRVNF